MSNRPRRADGSRRGPVWVSVILGSFAVAACSKEPVPTRRAPEPTSAQSPPPAAAPRANPQKPGEVSPERVSKTFSVYALSRGNGVPPEARAAQQRVQELVETDRSRGVRVAVEVTRIGIEGERRLCVAYENSQEGARALERVRAIVEGVDLVNLVEEPCTSAPFKRQQ